MAWPFRGKTDQPSGGGRKTGQSILPPNNGLWSGGKTAENREVTVLVVLLASLTNGSLVNYSALWWSTDQWQYMLNIS